MSEGDVTPEDQTEKCRTSDFEDRGRRPQAEEGGQLQEVGKGKEMDSLLEPPERNAALLTLVSSVRPILDF